jgi:mono/diheme cytochrome c family protein
MTRSRFVVLAVVFALAGCGRVSLPPGGPPPLVPATESRYPVRTDLLVTDLPAAVPPRFPTPGYPPPRSLQLGNRSPDADFVAQLRPLVGKTILDPQVNLSAAQREDVGRLLDAAFGSPAAPTIPVVPDWDEAARRGLVELNAKQPFWPALGTVQTPAGSEVGMHALGNRLSMTGFPDWVGAKALKRELGLDEPALARGGVLYRRWCLHCHGEAGGGDGSQAIQAGATPRDYRQGKFKFVSAFPKDAPVRSGDRGKPRKGDLKRTIHHGLDGTMMPPFPQFSDAELDDLAGYVIHLSIRGDVEFEVMRRVIELDTKPEESDPVYDTQFLEQLFLQKTVQVMAYWHRAANSPIPIPPEECPTEERRWASAVRGYKAFTTRGCLGCHASYGREQQLKYDAWGTVVRPRDLTLGVFRGGRRGEDLYARVYGGIDPSAKMPDYVQFLKSNPSVPGVTDEVWDVVHFLQALADPQARRTLDGLLRKEKEKDPSLNVIPFE